MCLCLAVLQVANDTDKRRAGLLTGRAQQPVFCLSLRFHAAACSHFSAFRCVFAVLNALLSLPFPYR